MNALLNCDKCGREGCESPGGPCYDCDADKRAGRPTLKKPMTNDEMHKIVHERAQYVKALEAQCRRAEEILEKICRGDYPQSYEILQSCRDVLNRREYIRLDEPDQPPMTYDEIVGTAPAHWRYLPHHPCRDCGHKPDEPGGDFCIPDGKEHIRLETTAAYLCEHANEVPQWCPCDPGCYCKHHTCKPWRDPVPVIDTVLGTQTEWIANDHVETQFDLVEHVAKALLNADLDQFGTCWPWPTGDTESELQAREDAREVALVAIKAFLSWSGHQRKLA